MSAPESARSRDRRTGANSSGAAPRMSVDARHAAVASLPDATSTIASALSMLAALLLTGP